MKLVGKIILAVIFVGVLGVGYMYSQDYEVVSPLSRSGKKTLVDKIINRDFKPQDMTLPLTKYDFDELRKRGGVAGKLEILGPIKAIEDRRENCKGENCMTKAELATFTTKQIRFEYTMPDGSKRKITGMMNKPLSAKATEVKPAIIMVRGFADAEGYYSGSGSWRIADRLAMNGYVTVSLDFLGFADSDMPSADILEARFEKVPAVLDLLETVKSLDFVDGNRIGFWAHSNGGQIVLSVLEITGENYPTVLWAPMTNPFPQSVIDTTGDDESGRKVRAKIEDFGQHYDFRRYAFENYYDWINAPIAIHQGTDDEWCKVDWQRKVVDSLRELGKEAKLTVWQGDDHNLSKNWREVAGENVGFYKKRLYN